MNLILLEPGEVDGTGRAHLHDLRADHIRDVLKADVGQQLRVGLLDGPQGMGTVGSSSAEGVTLTCAWEADTPPRPPVDLLLALPRPKVLKRLWAQLSALGVGQIILTNASRVERNYFDTHVLQPATYRPLLIEGLQQAGDTRLPTVSIHRRFKVLVEDELDDLFPDGQRWVAHPGGEAALAATGEGRLLLAIGPEGGWIPYELELLRQHGFTGVSMGTRTLRTDTACIALLSAAPRLRRGKHGAATTSDDTVQDV